MSNINDEVFDTKIKERIKNEINFIPNDINEKIDAAVKKATKRKFQLKKICSICAFCIASTILLGFTMPSYASNLPIIGSIFQMFNYKIFENYDKYASDLNITKESNGLKITINKVVYDEIELSIFYTVESENKMDTCPHFCDKKLKIDGKETTFSSGGTGRFTDDNKIYVGVIEYNVGNKNVVPIDVQNKMFLGGYVEIPDKFILNLNINEISSSGNSTINGKWNFDIPVTSEKILGKIKEQNCDIDLSKLVDGYHIKKLITTPLNTSIQGQNTFYENGPLGLSFIVFDDKGRIITHKSSESSGCKDKNGNYLNYFSNEFKEVYDDTKSLTFIPYKNNYNADSKSDYITTKFNKDGETNLYSSDMNELATITRINSENGKTKIYYKSKYGILVTPIEIIDTMTQEKILAIDNSNDRRTQQDNLIYLSYSDEYVLTYDKELTKKDFSIRSKDISKSIEVYNDDKFTLKIK